VHWDHYTGLIALTNVYRVAAGLAANDKSKPLCTRTKINRLDEYVFGGDGQAIFNEALDERLRAAFSR
jgi:hypothetical protein